MSEIMRYHPFDAEGYFWYIRKKMKWLVGIVGGISLGLTVLGSMPETGTGIVWRRTVPFLIVGLCCTVAPCVMYLLKKKLFIRQLQRGTEGKLSLALKVFNSLFLIVEVVLLFVVAAVSLLLLWGIFTDMVSPEIDESLMILRNFYGFVGSYLLIILAAFCLIVAALCRKKLFYVGAAIVFLLAVFILVFNAQNYTEFRENEFVIYHFGEKKVYQIEDIKSFRIYADKKDEQIQLELNFQDGVSRKTMGTAQTCSQRYEEQYYSDYNFIADYVAKLKEAGVSGELENTGKLQEYVEGLDRQVKQGLDKIIVEMEE